MWFRSTEGCCRCTARPSPQTAPRHPASRNLPRHRWVGTYWSRALLCICNLWDQAWNRWSCRLDCRAGNHVIMMATTTKLEKVVVKATTTIYLSLSSITALKDVTVDSVSDSRSINRLSTDSTYHTAQVLRKQSKYAKRQFKKNKHRQC